MPIRGDELVINPKASEYVGAAYYENFFVAGWLLARAIRDKILINTQLSPILIRQISGRRNGINQLARFDEDFYAQMCKLKNLNENVDKVTSI